MKVGVIGGGVSTEHEVSLASASGISAGLRESGHQVSGLMIDPSGRWHRVGASAPLPWPAVVRELAACDVIVPALHGLGGEDGTIQGLLECLGVAYVGSGVTASAICMDKELTKLSLGAAGLRSAPGMRCTPSQRPRTPSQAQALLAELGSGPWFVKPMTGGSSIGVTKIERADQLSVALDTALADSSSALIEAAITGPEVDVAVLQLPDGTLRCAPPLLIHPDPGRPFFDVDAKYRSGATEFVIPAPIGIELTQTLQRLAQRAFLALGCRGLARVDFFLSPDGPVLNEVNTFPGFTPASQFPKMWAATGMSYAELVDLLVTAAASERMRHAC